MTKRSWFWPFAAVLYAAGFWVAALWDLPINIWALRSAGVFGIAMECFGWYPAFLPAIMLALLAASQQRRRWQRCAAAAAAVCGFAGIFRVSLHYMEKRGILTANIGFAVLLIPAAGVLAAAFFPACRITPILRRKLTCFALWGTVYMAANQAVIYALKTLWARTRFDDMAAAGSFAGFTPWYQPFGGGGSSFPSGHTANACGILILLVLCDLFHKWGRHKIPVYLLCWGYVAAMAAARITIGRHFLSDTLAASAIMAVIFYIMRKTAVYRKTVSRANAGLTEPAACLNA